MSEATAKRESDTTACLRSGGQLESLGTEQFRVGGTSGGWKLFFGELAELGEGMLEFDVLACPACGHVELMMPRRS